MAIVRAVGQGGHVGPPAVWPGRRGPMRRTCLPSLLALSFFLVMLGRGQAQQPEPAPWDVPPVLTAPPPVPAAPPDSALSPWSLDVMFGLPTGIRAQRVLFEIEGRATLIEGFAGLEAIFPLAGGGLRERFTLLHKRGHDLTLSPGVSAYAVYNIFHTGGGWLGGGPTWFPLFA